MKYKDPDTGDFVKVNIKTKDTIPVGTEVDYNGATVPAGWEEIPSPNNTYSSSEIKTEKTWIDGKPIYRKTLTGTYPSSSASDVAHEISNASVIWIDGGHSYLTYTNGSTKPVSVVVPSGASRNPLYGAQVSVDTSNLHFNSIFVSSSDRAEEYTITLLYTKTTD